MEATDVNDPAAFERFLFPPAKAEDEAPKEEAAPETPAEPEGEPLAAEVAAETEDDDTEAEAEAPAPVTYTVKVDGKEVAVPLEELTRSYSGQAYIQKGMQEAANAKKQAEALYQTLQSEQANFLAAVEAIRTQGLVPPPSAPPLEMADSDPIGYIRETAKYQDALAKYNGQQAQIRQTEARRQAMQNQAMQEYLGQQAQILQERIPDFKDPAKAAHLKTELVKAGSEYGFSQEELETVVDARHIQVLHDAAQWRRLQAAKAVAVKPVPKSVPVAGKRAEPAQLSLARVTEKVRKTGGRDVQAFTEFLFKPQR